MICIVLFIFKYEENNNNTEKYILTVKQHPRMKVPLERLLAPPEEKRTRCRIERRRKFLQPVYSLRL